MKVLGLQQWWETEGYEHEDYLRYGGAWMDVEFTTKEDPNKPE